MICYLLISFHNYKTCMTSPLTLSFLLLAHLCRSRSSLFPSSFLSFYLSSFYILKSTAVQKHQKQMMLYQKQAKRKRVCALLNLHLLSSLLLSPSIPSSSSPPPSSLFPPPLCTNTTTAAKPRVKTVGVMEVRTPDSLLYSLMRRPKKANNNNTYTRPATRAFHVCNAPATHFSTKKT